jgi:hypothetical protein
MAAEYTLPTNASDGYASTRIATAAIVMAPLTIASQYAMFAHIADKYSEWILATNTTIAVCGDHTTSAFNDSVLNCLSYESPFFTTAIERNASNDASVNDSSASSSRRSAAASATSEPLFGERQYVRGVDGRFALRTEPRAESAHLSALQSLGESFLMNIFHANFWLRLCCCNNVRAFFGLV